MVRINVELGYHCPFCPDHQDKAFYTSALINVPICEGCREELFHFSQLSTRPNDLLIEKVEKQTGKSWSECKMILLRDSLAYWKSVASGQQPDWFRMSFDKLGWSEKKSRAYVRKQIQRYQTLISKEV